MKRFTAVLIGLALCLTLASCSQESSQEDETGTTHTTAALQYFDPTRADESGDDTTVGETYTSAGKTSTSSTAVPKSSSTTTTAAPVEDTVRVTIPEGYSASQIGSLLEEKGVCKKAAFLSTVNSYDFSYYSLVAKIPSSEHRCYKLEGYLFPNTYEFYKDMKPQDAIGKMLRGAQSGIGSKYSYSGMSTDEVVTLASIIEKEAGSLSEMKKVSSVFHNRLKKGMKLQSEATIYYVERYLKPNLSGDINRYNSYYNTNKCSALPAGAICNPGANALQAAANPANTEYLYFVASKDGVYYYAKTYEEHVENCKKAGMTDYQ